MTVKRLSIMAQTQAFRCPKHCPIGYQQFQSARSRLTLGVRDSSAVRQLLTARMYARCQKVSPRCRRSRQVVAPRTVAEATLDVLYKHSLVALLDRNPFLSDGSKQAVATAGILAKRDNSKVTVVLLDSASLADTDRKTRLETVMWHFNQVDFSEFEVMEKQAGNVAVTLGDVADEVCADLLIMSVECVHAKAVDANLLAEFVPCPMLLLP